MGPTAHGDIAVVGHHDLTDGSLRLVESAVRTRLARLAGRARAMVRAAAGTALASGRAARASGLPLPAPIARRNARSAGEPSVQPNRETPASLAMS